ncbi:sperm acrosome membrane-associated protein 4-like [Sphaerodactylus townsendi]|uniref:sperm acrosome membrane-associated protein 4-like n=1 Tax=Sphaerodactylus townsendi TaxID=933632 RepID=UPI0020266C3B|nr:sperm acrosome membrane-associated protein 4-like [Sphaerodactylus townsendi]
MAAATWLFAVAFFQMALCQDVEKKSLQCYYCGYEQACGKTSVQCQEGERCSTMSGNSDYKVHDPIFGKGCVSAAKCGHRDRISLGHNPYRVTYTCCNTDLCNDWVSGSDNRVITSVGHISVPTHLPWLFAAVLLAALSALLS